ncbi:MAG: GTP 3',8-cyclase MoaA [Spirochaetia bacterium]|nr:GTP 3',8-cyclase MoaA [Spirochaetia bacterium]
MDRQKRSPARHARARFHPRPRRARDHQDAESREHRQFLNLKDTFGRPLRDLRLSLTDRCNFRCTYCMPADREHHFLPDESCLTANEIESLAKIFLSLGVEKIRLTGGEPLLRDDLLEIVSRLRALSPTLDLALTTNGFQLDRIADSLKKAGLTRLTVSLDALDQRNFGRMSGSKGHVARVLGGIEAASKAGFEKIKINAVIKRGVNEQEVLPLAERFRGSDTILRFIEYMDVGNQNGWSPGDVFPAKEILSLLQRSVSLVSLEENYFGEVARRYRYADGTGEIGFITSISEPFCSSCTRARLSADGKFYTCLFSGNGHDLLSPLRAGASESEMKSLIEKIWTSRNDRYSEERSQQLVAAPKVEMYQIGG